MKLFSYNSLASVLAVSLALTPVFEKLILTKSPNLILLANLIPIIIT